MTRILSHAHSIIVPYLYQVYPIFHIRSTPTSTVRNLILVLYKNHGKEEKTIFNGKESKMEMEMEMEIKSDATK